MQMRLLTLLVVFGLLGVVDALEQEEREQFQFSADRVRDIRDGYCFVRRAGQTDFERRARCARMVRAVDGVPECLPTQSWICSLNKSERKIFSQNGEDGILLQLLHRFELGGAGSTYVEFGVEDGRECVTRVLREGGSWRSNWSGVLLDGSNSNSSLNLHREFITEENICALFAKYNVSKSVTLLVVDIDFHDYHVLEKILRCGYVPKLIVTEYNAAFGPYVSWTVPSTPISDGWDTSDFFGASIQAFAKLGRRFGYSLLCSESNGVNLFFAHNALLSSSELPNITEQYVASRYHAPKYGVGGHQRLNPSPSSDRDSVVELISYESEAAMFSSRGHQTDWLARSAELII